MWCKLLICTVKEQNRYKVKVKSLSMPGRHIGEVEVQLHSFLISALTL